ncbi:MAG TPA: hypothetical protein EYP87_02730 [Flavobacteriaceae bacterium]|nr:hypothetical protein [Flavobacteriaceae bacterium]
MIADAMIIRDIKNDDNRQKAVESLIMKSVEKHEDLITRINHYRLIHKENQTPKQYFNDIAKEAIDFFNDTYKQLNDIIQEK